MGRRGYGGVWWFKKRLFFCPLQFVYMRTTYLKLAHDEFLSPSHALQGVHICQIEKHSFQNLRIHICPAGRMCCMVVEQPRVTLLEGVSTSTVLRQLRSHTRMAHRHTWISLRDMPCGAYVCAESRTRRVSLIGFGNH